MANPPSHDVVAAALVLCSSEERKNHDLRSRAVVAIIESWSGVGDAWSMPGNCRSQLNNIALKEFSWEELRNRKVIDIGFNVGLERLQQAFLDCGGTATRG